jgi:hypothetical protein
MDAAIAKASCRTIKSVEDLVAHISLWLQAILLRMMLSHLRMAPPDWSVFHLMWDETGERLVVDVLGNMTALEDFADRREQFLKAMRGECSLWQVLVMRCTSVWGYASGTCMQCMFTAPPPPLSKVGAEALWAGLVQHKGMEGQAV